MKSIRRSGAMHPHPLLIILLLLFPSIPGEHVRDLEISEGAPVGTRIGFIGDGALESGPPYLIVPVTGSAVDSDLHIDHTTGEIQTKVPLDREARASYSLVAIPLSGDNVRVIVRVLDENDNAPTFPSSVMNIEFPENTPRDVKRTLNPARDLDLGIYNTQRYNIVSGNVNNAFRLSSHRERDGVLYLDLQINGFLDRETTPEYSLVIEALDGGTPPLRGEMTVNIKIVDVNDNQPIFNQSRYFATVPENATVGTNVLQVFANDADSGDNGQVEYSINRRQSDRDSMFRIDSTSGVISVNKPLDFETKELHELVIVAKDHGLQPLETTAFVSIRVTDVNDNRPQINVIFLSDDATPKISESAQPGEFVARISVHDPDSKTEYSNINVTLSGGDGHFGLTTRDNIIYLVIVSLPLDREIQPNYTLSVVATDTGTPPLHASRTIHLQVTDINDCRPEFDQEEYHANVMEVSDPGSSVIQISATDKDEGNNSAIVYTLLESPDTHSNWFQINPKSGLITTKAHVDCETDPVPQLTVVATDSGFPPLSSSVKVFVTIHDVNDNEPIFDQSFYNVSVAENEAAGRCILKVSATDPDCGVNAMVNYTLGEGFGKLREFEVRSVTGEVCIAAPLDYETRNSYEFPVVATDRGGLSTTAMVTIQLIDINDNKPIFYPNSYNVSLREGNPSSATSPIVIVAATDPDSGKYGAVSYRIVSGNDAGLFRMDRATGELFLSRPSLLNTRSNPYHKLNISASDGGGLKSIQDAEVFISVIDSKQRPPIFEHSKYGFKVKEDVKPGAIVGNVKASINDNGGRRPVRYSIYSGDPNGFFSIDASSGIIRAASHLDHETRSSVLLNVQATSGDPPSYGHTQVNIEIIDVNDNSPEFESNTVRISVPENVDLGVALYAAHAKDRDSGQNGKIQYRIAGSNNSGGKHPPGKNGPLFAVDPKTGHVTLTRHLDFESAQRHTLVVTASDMGVPPLETNLTILVEVQDINDNIPVFEQKEYTVKIMESLAVNTQILQVTAVDLDTGNNARLTYKLIPSSNISSAAEEVEVFEIFPNSGWIYLRGSLDREHRDRYDLTITATDNGTPSESATARVVVHILDANDNDPKFSRDLYEFSIEENLRRGAVVGNVHATDADLDINAIVKYSLIPGNTSFHINSATGEIMTREPLDRESKPSYDLIVEARDQGTPSRSSRVPLRIQILDVNDNAPIIVDPQEDVVSVREEQPPNTEVVRVRAIDSDNGYNATITYSILKGRDSDGYGIFSIDPMSGIIRTKTVLDHEERAIYRLAVAATDSGKPPRQTVRLLRVEVLDLNDNRPTFTSSSLMFQVREDITVGHIVGSVVQSDPIDTDNMIHGSGGGHITYTLTSLISDKIPGAFDIDRSSGSLVVARQLDRETQSEYRLEVRALDTSAMNNPQSSAVTVKVDITDANDNFPKWSQDPIVIPIAENTVIGSPVYNFSASDSDFGANGEVRYSLMKVFPILDHVMFSVDALTGTLTLLSQLDYETLPEYTLIVRATDQSLNISERLTTSVTARIIVTDSNDNDPKFVFPASNTININNGLTAGMVVSHLVAIDYDSGDNGRVSYVISSGNENGRFSLGYDTGVLTLAKSIVPENEDQEITYLLNITANDHGKPSRQATLALKLNVHGSSQHPPRFLNTIYDVKIPEDASVGSFVVKVNAKSSLQETGGNLSYYIPPGIADDLFAVDPKSGVVTTTGRLDRERISSYTVPIYVSDTLPQRNHDHNSQFDVAMLSIEITDVNDHTPEFRPGACYPIMVPENGELAVIHRVVAMDLDDGSNGDITYSISAGNIGNKFNIDARTGELSARSLDRETQSRYLLTIIAQDRGSPISLQGSCNISIRVEDQNDNDPKFDTLRYTSSISEDAPSDTSVLRVHASDADLGLNARIIYSLANESHWLFRIDNKTGVITTAGPFDRERKDSYEFFVVATDQGKYDARSQRVPVKITINDVNDNKPIFTRYPFKEKIAAFLQPGQTLLQISATDADIGINSDIVYSIVNEPSHSKFRINPTSGVITASQSLASDNGRVIYLQISATDKGNPPRSTTGLVEISVGDVPSGTPRLRFQNQTYSVTLPENTPSQTDVLQLSAVRSDGRRQKITYSFGRGNEDNIFTIDPDTGRIQVRDPEFLDYERQAEINLVIEAKAEGSPTLYGYCNVVIKLIDQNDSAPRFTQQQYSASVWEGNNKGTFVMQIQAYDDDQGQNSRVLYHIVDGNHDNAFIIEPAFSGIVKTNIVLDREIRDTYRLTVIATDEGVPQMTGTARIRINIVDINDNRPTFPPHSIITISEATEVGTVLTAVTANDVDTNPALTYSFAHDSDEETSNMFSIDRFSGKVILSRSLDFESKQEYQLKITASDTAHTANTMLTIRVTDVNDNAPIFQQAAYHALLPEGRSDLNLEVIQVNASDLDSGENAKIYYSLLKPVRGFSIGDTSGILYVNQSELPRNIQDIQLAVIAIDSGSPPLQSVASVRIKVNSGDGSQPYFANKEYKVRLSEASPRGTTVVQISSAEIIFRDRKQPSQFYIANGNEDGVFEVANSNGVIMLVRTLDRETRDSYILHLIAGEPGLRIHEANASVITVNVIVDDSNDNAPVFQQNDYETTISEAAAVGTSVIQISATDADLQGTSASDIIYDITSGNDLGRFELDPISGLLSVKNTLDYDNGVVEQCLVVRACDQAPNQLCSMTNVLITLQDENDNAPKFPVTEYLEFVGENEPIGTAVFTAHATDMDKGVFGTLNYSIISAASSGYTGIDDSWKLFRVDASSGLVSTSAIFDYEQRNRYVFMLRASDFGGRIANVKVRVEIESRDEFHPQFTERTYRFILATPTSNNLPVGYIIGHVTATDRDKGPDGRVVYQLTTQHPYFKINRTTGAVTVKKKLDNALVNIDAGRDISLVVTASSGRQGSLTNMTVVEIILDPLADPGTNLAIDGSNYGRNNYNNGTAVSTANGGLADWILGLLIALVLLILCFGGVFLFWHMKNRRNKVINKPNLSAPDSVASTNNYVDPSAFDTIPIRGNGTGVVPGGGQFAPPKYDEIPPYGPGPGHHPASSNSGAATTSELSGSEQSGSSGRGSAEDGDDGEDEEIRMINEGPLQREAGMIGHRNDMEDDNLSDMSVHNTQEYLARLGIVNSGQTVGSSGATGQVPQSVTVKEVPSASVLHHQGVGAIPMHIYDEEGTGEPDLTNLIYAKLNDVTGGSDRTTSGDEGAVAVAVSGNGRGFVPHHQPSMNGSLSSIVHSEEELTGSYNWDYLLDWGPQYQPLAHVFSEIARLKDDSVSVASAASGGSSVKSKASSAIGKNVPPPLLTNVAPRAIQMPTLANRSVIPSSSHLPRSPINHDASVGTFSAAAAMSPSFSPSLSPLATKSPSISPLVAPGLPVLRQATQPRTAKTVMETELRI